MHIKKLNYMKLGSIPLLKKNYNFYDKLSPIQKREVEGNGVVNSLNAYENPSTGFFTARRYYFDILKSMVNKNLADIGIEFKVKDSIDNFAKFNDLEILLFNNVHDHTDDYYSLYYFLNIMIKGSGKLIFDGRFSGKEKVVDLNPGDVVLFNPLVTHRFEKTSKDKFCVMYAMNILRD